MSFDYLTKDFIFDHTAFEKLKKKHLPITFSLLYISFIAKKVKKLILEKQPIYKID